MRNTENSLDNYITKIIEILITLACIFSGVTVVSSILSNRDIWLGFLCISIYFLSFLARKFILKAKSVNDLNGLSYILLSCAFAGFIYNLLPVNSKYNGISPLEIVPVLSPYIIIFIAFLLIQLLLKGKYKKLLFILLLVVLIGARPASDVLAELLRDHKLITSLIIGSPAVYMFTILFGLNEVDTRSLQGKLKKFYTKFSF